MLDQVRWIRVLPVVLVGFVVGNLAGGWELGVSTALGFLIGGVLFEAWWRPRMLARMERRDAERDRS